MKKFLLLNLALVLTYLVNAQTVLEQPKIGMSTASNLNIEKIELSDSTTVLWFHSKSTPGNRISIPKKTYILAVGSKDTLYIVSSEGIPLNKQYTFPASGEVSYKLTFPKIDSSVGSIDYGEANDGGTWFIYDIQLKPELLKSMIPEKITGNWFRSDNAQWKISLFDSVAVYKSQVWKYLQYSEKQGTGKIKLKNGSKNFDLYIKTSDNGTCLIGETPSKLVNYTHTPDESLIPAYNETFKLPVFKVDTAIYCGYIKGFNPRLPQKTGLVAVNDVLTGEQNSFLLTISDDGTFKVKIPHTNPQTVMVRFPFAIENIFIEPGKTTFHLIDKGGKSNQNLFMGDDGRINSDLQKLKSISSFDYNQMQEKILDFSPEQYKDWCQTLQLKDLTTVDEFARKHSVSAKAIQIKKIEIDYRYASYIMEYNSNVESAYRKKNKIPQTQREIPFKPAKPDSSYYSFLTNELVNNELAVLVSDYYFFINRLMYLDILRGNPKGFTTPEIITEMKKAGYKITPEEKEMTEQLEATNSPELKKIQKEFQEKNGKQSTSFYQKYGNKITLLYKEKKGSIITPSMIEEYLIGQKVEFTDEEKAFLLAMKELNENPLVQKNNLIQAQYNKEIQQFYNDHRVFISGLSQQSRIAEREEKLQKTLGIQPGFASDIMASQNFCRPFASEMTPVPDEKIRAFQQKISTPFIASYVQLLNNETKAKIAANKNLKGSKVNEVPKTSGDKIFDAIISKYKGKVIYVDFWATWCAPCRAGIERIKSLKEEMAEENVAFVYISGPSSPKTTYDNMIPTIKGDHYRVSDDEWNILCAKFKISGIPHYVLVGKDGKVINPQLGHLENTQLKSLLMKHIKG